MAYLETVAKNIRTNRIRSGLSQQEMADKLAISRSSYCQIEKGKRNVNVEKLQKIAVILGVSVNDLYFSKEAGSYSITQASQNEELSENVLRGYTQGISVDYSLMQKAKQLFEELGLTIEAAVTIFFKQALREKAIPFAVSCRTFNEETLSAIQETEQILKSPHLYKQYNSADELFNELKISCDEEKNNTD